MTNDPIDFNTAKDHFKAAIARREDAALEAEQARWEALADQLHDAMASSDLYHTAVVTAALNALLSFLTEKRGLAMPEAKDCVSKRLAIMFIQKSS